MDDTHAGHFSPAILAQPMSPHPTVRVEAYWSTFIGESSVSNIYSASTLARAVIIQEQKAELAYRHLYWKGWGGWAAVLALNLSSCLVTHCLRSSEVSGVLVSSVSTLWADLPQTLSQPLRSACSFSTIAPSGVPLYSFAESCSAHTYGRHSARQMYLLHV
jgi:hypothetical protein